MRACPKDTEWCFTCDECARAFTRRGQLNRHLKKHQDPSNWFTCEACTYKSYQRSNVALHAKAKHGKRPKKHSKDSGTHLADDLSPTRHSIDDSQHPRSPSETGLIGTSSTQGVLNSASESPRRDRYDPPPGPPPNVQRTSYHITPEPNPLSPDRLLHSTAIFDHLSTHSRQWSMVDSKSDPIQVSNTLPYNPMPASVSSRVFDPPSEPPPGYGTGLPNNAIEANSAFVFEQSYPTPHSPGEVQVYGLQVSVTDGSFTSWSQVPMRRDRSGHKPAWVSPSLCHQTKISPPDGTGNGHPATHVHMHMANNPQADRFGPPFSSNLHGAWPGPKVLEYNSFQPVMPSHASALPQPQPQPSAPPWHTGLHLQHGIVNGEDVRADPSLTMQPVYALASPSLASATYSTTVHSAPPDGAIRTGHGYPATPEGVGASDYN